MLRYMDMSILLQWKLRRKLSGTSLTMDMHTIFHVSPVWHLGLVSSVHFTGWMQKHFADPLASPLPVSYSLLMFHCYTRSFLLALFTWRGGTIASIFSLIPVHVTWQNYNGFSASPSPEEVFFFLWHRVERWDRVLGLSHQSSVQFLKYN